MRACSLAALYLVLSLAQTAFCGPPASGNGVGGQSNVPRNRPSVQNGTGRLGQSAIPGAAGRANATARINSRTTIRTQPQQSQRPQQAGTSTNQPQRTTDPRAAGQSGVRVASTPAEARRQEFRRRLAEIDHQRDVALRVGDRRRLDEADRMEHELRARFSAEETAAARANAPHGPTTPGYGRMTAQEAHAASNGQANAYGHLNHPQPPANHPGFTPGYGRLTAEQAQALKLNPPPTQQPLPPAEQPPAQQPPAQQSPAQQPPAEQPPVPGPVQ